MDNFQAAILTVTAGWFWMIVGFARLLQERTMETLDILFWSLWGLLAVVIIDPPAWRGNKMKRVCRCFRCGP